MVIAPSGKRRLMIAQTYMDPTLQQDGAPIDDAVGFGGAPGMGQSPAEQLGQEVEEVQREDEMPEEGTTEADLTDYLFNKLQEFGYPGRRLQEFKSKFVTENIAADGNKTVEIVIPSTYYGKNKEVPDSVFGKFIKEIEKKFNLFFDGASKAEGKATIKFTSVNQKDDPDQMVEEDELSRVYGQPSKDSISNERHTTASTIYELIGDQKDDMMEKLAKIIGVTK
jgi:hypothetical protein